MNEKRRIGWIITGMAGILLVTLLAAELPVQDALPAQEMVRSNESIAGEIGGGILPSSVGQEPPPPPPGRPGENDEEGDEDDEGGDVGTTTVVERHTIWRILFPYETLGDAVKTALVDIVDEMTNGLVSQIQDALNHLGRTVLHQEGMFLDVRRDLWRVSIVIAGILMPLSFMISVGSALKDGTSSVTGYASAREAILNWVIAAGAAVSSYFILTKGIELASMSMVAIFEGLLGEINSSFNLGDNIIGSLILSGMMTATPGPGQIFMSFFGMLLAVGLIASIGLALLAREVILLLIVGIAPITLILGSIGPLRWLSGIWTKITTVALILGPANALLIGAAALLGLKAHQTGLSGGGITDRILGYLVALGILSVLIGLNTLIGKTVYGAVIEIAGKAMKGVMAVVNLAGIALGVAAAPAIAGMVGGTGAATTGGLGSVAEASSQMRLTSAIGQGIARTGLPGTKGFAAGLNIGGAAEAHKQVKQGIAKAAEAKESERTARQELKTRGEPWVESDLSMNEAINSAHGELTESLSAGGTRGVLASTGIAPEDASMRLDYGMQFSRNLMGVAEKHGIDMQAGLRQLGFPGTNAQNAGTGYARSSISQAAFGHASPYKNPVPWRNLPQEFTAVDLDVSRQILSSARQHSYSHAPSESMIDNVAQVAYQRRIQLNEAPYSIVNEATKAPDLNLWMRDSYNNLPDRSLAEDLRKGLGL
jgi:hypothetical protein